MEFEKLKTRQELAHELGISYRTLLRKIKAAKLKLTSGILTYDEMQKVRDIFKRTKV